MKRCASCGRAVDDSSGLAEHAACPWCGGELAHDIAGPRTLADAVQLLWSVDPEAPYDGKRAERDLADLCPGVRGAGSDVFVAGEVGALALLRDGKAEAARRALRVDAHWDDAAVETLTSAYLSLDPQATQADAEEQKRLGRDAEERIRHKEELLHQAAKERMRYTEAMRLQAERLKQARQEEEKRTNQEVAKPHTQEDTGRQRATRYKHRKWVFIAIALTIAAILFPVLSKSVAFCTVSIDDENIVYNGKARRPAVTVRTASDTLVEGTDYKLRYSDNTNAGEATVEIRGIGSYTGTTQKHFTINKAKQRLKARLAASTIKAGQTTQIRVSTKASRKVHYKSKDKSVATVDSKGKVTGKAMGKAVIKVWVSESPNYCRTIKKLTITVTEDLSILVSPSSLSVGVGETKEVRVTIKGELPDKWQIFSWDSLAYNAEWKEDWVEHSCTLAITGRSPGFDTCTLRLTEGSNDDYDADKLLATAELKVHVHSMTDSTIETR